LLGNDRVVLAKLKVLVHVKSELYLNVLGSFIT